MKVLVTGAAGFIGSHLAEALLTRGYEVRGFDNFETGRVERIKSLEDRTGFEFLEGDLESEADVQAAVSDVGYVFHQAALASVPKSIENPTLTTTANCLGTTNLLVAAENEGVERAVVASSSAVYGSGGTLPKREDHPVSPESPYALSKYWTEELAVEFDEFYDIETVALRYFNVFGPGQDPNGEYAAVIPKFIDLMLQGEQPIIYGDGEQSRDFAYVENVVEANVRAAESTCSGEKLNVACNHRLTINELVEHINDILGTDIEAIHDDPRPGDVRHSYADISKAEELLDYSPVVEFEEGLKRTVDSLRE